LAAGFRAPLADLRTPVAAGMLAGVVIGNLAQLTKENSMTTNSSNRWLIAAAGVVMQLALGAVYAWSVFRIPLTKSYGWTVPQVTLAFELAILTLGDANYYWLRYMKMS
jgi:hypothetical protein